MNQPKRIVEFSIPGVESAIAELNRKYFNPAIDKAAEPPTDPLVGREVTLPNGSRGRVRERATDDSNLLFVSLPDGSEKVFSTWELSLINEAPLPQTNVVSRETGEAL